MPWVLRRERPDVFHAPHYVLPPAVRVPVGRDDSRLHPPDVSAVPAEPRGLRLRARVDVERGAAVGPHPHRVGGVQARHPPLLQRAARERSSSSTTRSTSASGSTPPEEDIARVRERYQLDHGFVLYAGNIKPHKNLVRLIEAFDELRQARLRRAEAADHRRRDLEAAGAAPRGAQPQAAQARALSRLPAGRDAGRSSTGWPRCSSSRRSTKDSACRRSRRWRAARRSSPRTSRRCPRSPATPRCSSIRTTSTSIVDGMRARADRPGAGRRAAAQGPGARARVLVGALGRADARALRRGRRAGR